uniref:Uncharacterized protein n=1 Tax=Tetranychus urticae TaxID=32264 RepID=T1K1M7_TETUR
MTVQPLTNPGSSNLNLDDGPVVADKQHQTTTRDCGLQCTLLEAPKVINKLDSESQCEVVLSRDVQLQCFLLVPAKDIPKLDSGTQCDVVAQNYFEALDLNVQSESSLVEKMDVEQQCFDELQIHDIHFESDSEFIEPCSTSYQVTSTTGNDTVSSVADPVDDTWNSLEFYISDVSYHHVYIHKGVEFKYIMVEKSTPRAISLHEKKQIINKYI